MDRSEGKLFQIKYHHGIKKEILCVILNITNRKIHTMLHTTDFTFAKTVLEDSKIKPIVVKFTADWCGPCRALAPILQQIAETHKDKITIVELDTDANVQTAQAYKISSIPTLMVFVNGEVVKTIVGAKPKSAIEKELSNWLQ